MQLKIAVLGSYTLNGIEKPLTAALQEDGFDVEMRFGGFNQFNQELIDSNSWLYAFKPDITVIALTTKTFFPDLQLDICSKDFAAVKKMCSEKIQLLTNAIAQCGLSTKFLLTNLDVPLYSPYGNIDVVRDDGVRALISHCNALLVKAAQSSPSLSLIDFDALCGGVGKLHMTDAKMHYLGKIELGKDLTEAFVAELQTQVHQSFGKVKKCLVVDLDNTLWGGVIGEDGVNGVELGDSNIGAIYTDIQKYLLALKNMGVLLAIVSKNNEEDVLPIFAREEMLLKEEDFIARRINWEPKSVNIESIAQELNLGLESFVFLDDNPAERLEVGSQLPVSVIDFPNDVAKLPGVLERCSLFWNASVTEEDKKRHDMYVQEKQRKQLQGGSLQNYLQELGSKIVVKRDDLVHLERIAQLTNKTNQFNVRTQRYSTDVVESMMSADTFSVFSTHVRDKFGELGLTGVLIFEEREPGVFFIDTFLMSCRVLFREIEQQFFAEAVKALGSFEKIVGEFIPSKKNKPCEKVFEKLGFSLVEENEEHALYELTSFDYDSLSVDAITVMNDE